MNHSKGKRGDCSGWLNHKTAIEYLRCSELLRRKSKILPTLKELQSEKAPTTKKYESSFKALEYLLITIETSTSTLPAVDSLGYLGVLEPSQRTIPLHIYLGYVPTYIEIDHRCHHQKRNNYRDPITEFLECLYVNFNFILNDFFIALAWMST